MIVLHTIDVLVRYNLGPAMIIGGGIRFVWVLFRNEVLMLNEPPAPEPAPLPSVADGYFTELTNEHWRQYQNVVAGARKGWEA